MESSAMNEEFATVGDGIDLCFEQFGSPEDPTVLLIMGLGGPMTWWPDSLCALLAERGFHVVRYDNRDTGRSTKITGAPVSKRDLVSGFLGRSVSPAYTLSDLATDAVGLLDHLEVERAHVMGVSMGGMIAQTIAIEHPERVASLVSIMSTTGRRLVGWQNPIVFPGLLKPHKPGREEYIARSLQATQSLQSGAFPTPDDVRRRRAEITYDRGFSASGVGRHMLAVVTQPDRTEALRGLDVPTVVVHGTRDVMVHRSGGKATASAIPGAEMWWVPKMGHDLPEQLNHVFANALERAVNRARQAA